MLISIHYQFVGYLLTHCGGSAASTGPPGNLRSSEHFVLALVTTAVSGDNLALFLSLLQEQ